MNATVYTPYDNSANSLDGQAVVEMASCSTDGSTVIVPMRVIIHAVPQTAIICPTSPLERKRQFFWHSDHRNVAIARLANALANRRIEELWEAGCLLDVDSLSTVLPESNHLAILVESPEHARSLGRLLPQWSIQQVIPGTESGPDALPGHIIITMAAAAMLPWHAPDAIIVAHGGPWVDSVVSLASDGVRLIVDLRDDFDDFAVEETESRIDHYTRQGWQIDGVKAGSQPHTTNSR